jgi:CDP-diacylglycerol--glycerol-3-phosphate 3-phosphatidyltransferase
VTTYPLLSPPNLVSLARFPMAAAFVALDHAPSRLVLLALASISDLLDGWLARRSGKTSTLGALLDPIADKTFVFVALLVFVLNGTLGLGAMLIVISRDLATLAGFIVAWRHPELTPLSFRARWPGKLVTVLQILVLLALVVAPEHLRVLIPAIAVASVLAIVDYTRALSRTRGTR